MNARQNSKYKKMDDDVFVGCICCMGRNNLCNLFGQTSGKESYAKLLDDCFNIKVNSELRFICADCVVKLKVAVALKDQINTTLSMLVSNEEHLDESIFEPDLIVLDTNISTEETQIHESNKKMYPEAESNQLEVKINNKNKFSCHFCDNFYASRKACYIHLRTKHGLKLTTNLNCNSGERKTCECNRNLSQQSNPRKELGAKSEKRKALNCPLCDERVSYGVYFSDHLLSEHDIEEQVEEIHFQNMDEFFQYKADLQARTKYRFRKTTSTKKTIEGLRSHYMCSQSGVYRYQGKGIRPTPERQIYKTGKACPAHMVVTESSHSVLVIFHKTHVGHGACPYYQPRVKREKCGQTEVWESHIDRNEDSKMAWVCDECGMVFLDSEDFGNHSHKHAVDSNEIKILQE